MLSPLFLVLYLTAATLQVSHLSPLAPANAVLQVGLLLHVASVMVHSMWGRGVDPDNSAIPYLTALGDLLGGALLAGVFYTVDTVDSIG